MSELEQIERRFADAPDPGFRARAVDEYNTIRGLVGRYVDFEAARILDFGCGAGIAAASFALRHPKATVFGADISRPDQEQLQALCRKQIGFAPPENLSLFWNEAGMLAAEICNLDMIYTWSVFEHVNFAQIADTLRLIRGRLRANGIVLLQINPLYFSPRGSHLYRYDPTPWMHLLHPIDVLKDKVVRSTIPRNTKVREWQQFEGLNRATIHDIKEAANDAGFSLLLEEKADTVEEPPDRLLRIYDRDVLIAEELRLVLA